jgi:hypothetical protein
VRKYATSKQQPTELLVSEHAAELRATTLTNTRGYQLQTLWYEQNKRSQQPIKLFVSKHAAQLRATTSTNTRRYQLPTHTML